jgi:transformation/transcription domain-associated protein
VVNSIDERIKILQSLPEKFDQMDQQEYQIFLEKILPLLFSFLREIPPAFEVESENQKIRSTILEVIHRLPTTNPLRTLAQNVSTEIMNIIAKDNDVNAIRCLNILIQLHKVFFKELASHVPPFLEFIKNLYRHFEKTTKDAIETSLQTTAHTPQEDNNSKLLKRSILSFKLMAECPLHILILLQVCQ